jgi:hypothetical protein
VSGFLSTHGTDTKKKKESKKYGLYFYPDLFFFRSADFFLMFGCSSVQFQSHKFDKFQMMGQHFTRISLAFGFLLDGAAILNSASSSLGRWDFRIIPTRALIRWKLSFVTTSFRALGWLVNKPMPKNDGTVSRKHMQRCLFSIHCEKLRELKAYKSELGSIGSVRQHKKSSKFPNLEEKRAEATRSSYSSH